MVTLILPSAIAVNIQQDNLKFLSQGTEIEEMCKSLYQQEL